MAILDEVGRLRAEGKFAEALAVLDREPVLAGDIEASRILRADLLEAVGEHEAGCDLARRILRNTRLAASQRAACEVIIGRVTLESGRVDEAISIFQRALALSERARDLQQICWIQGRLVGVLAESRGPGAVVPLLAELRRNITRLGDPHTTAQTHLFVSEMEGRQGRLGAARRHATLALEFLQQAPNSWLAAWSHNVLLAVAVLETRIEDAKRHSDSALKFSGESGAVAARRAAAANTGHLLQVCGRPEESVTYFEQALGLIASNGERNNAILETLAQVRLQQGRLDECAQLLTQIDAHIQSERDRLLYSHRNAELTRSRLKWRMGDFAGALESASYAVALAGRSGDDLLRIQASLAKACALASLGLFRDCAQLVCDLVYGLRSVEASILAWSQAIVGTLLAPTRPLKASHYRRASLAVAGASANVMNLTAIDQYNSDSSPAGPTASSNDGFKAGFEMGCRHAFQLLSLATTNSSSAETTATAIGQVLSSSGCIERFEVSRSERIASQHSSEWTHVFTIADSSSRSAQLAVVAGGEFDDALMVSLVNPVVNSLTAARIASVDQEKRAALWPIEEISHSGTSAVISGHMRELMVNAQKVARTNVSVLITGESGTGKEILARAIHDFSDRAQKPFVPFNCAAVPRDLLESQLFGHRRGAFTGADRDNPGLIRTAGGGTVFLDEVGEMTLEAQPKLLRFLESGEIAPLGEPSPLTVNVRVIAATNASLDIAVQNGKFREDLFYRLNVVRLTILPLRERRDEIPGLVNHFVKLAAEEFKKGRLEVAEGTMERLTFYRWPGNVRQLQNEVRRMVALAEPNSALEPHMIAPAILGSLPDLRRTGVNGHEIAVPLHDKLPAIVARVEYEMIKAALHEHKGRLDPAARALGISRKGLYLKRQRLGL